MRLGTHLHLVSALALTSDAAKPDTGDAAELAADALPHALAELERQAQAFREARVNFYATTKAAGEQRATAILTRPEALASLGCVLFILDQEQEAQTTTVNSIGGAAPRQIADQAVSRGQARAAASCPCGMCPWCEIKADLLAQGADPETAIAHVMAEQQTPSDLVGPDGNPLRPILRPIQ